MCIATLHYLHSFSGWGIPACRYCSVVLVPHCLWEGKLFLCVQPGGCVQQGPVTPTGSISVWGVCTCAIQHHSFPAESSSRRAGLAYTTETLNVSQRTWIELPSLSESRGNVNNHGHCFFFFIPGMFPQLLKSSHSFLTFSMKFLFLFVLQTLFSCPSVVSQDAVVSESTYFTILDLPFRQWYFYKENKIG